MYISKGAQRGAVSEHILTEDQMQRLKTYVESREGYQAFSFTSVMYYFFGAVMIGGVSLFVTLEFSRLPGAGIAGIAAAIFAVALVIGTAIRNKSGLTIPAGILATLSIVVVPLFVYGVQKHLGHWDVVGVDGVSGRGYAGYHTHVDYRWLTMEISTLVAASVLLALYRIPFMVMPVAVTLWYLCMDLSHYMSHVEGSGYGSYWSTYQRNSVWFGLLTIAFAGFVDVFFKKAEKDFAFWLYLCGVVTFWGAVTSMDSSDDLSKHLYALMNLVMVMAGGLIGRRVFAVFGGMGVAYYMSWLATKFMADSISFMFVCLLFGLIGMGAVYLYAKFEKRIHQALLSRLQERAA